jgi:hypothetical protein
VFLGIHWDHDEAVPCVDIEDLYISYWESIRIPTTTLQFSMYGQQPYIFHAPKLTPETFQQCLVEFFDQLTFDGNYLQQVTGLKWEHVQDLERSYYFCEIEDVYVECSLIGLVFRHGNCQIESKEFLSGIGMLL